MSLSTIIMISVPTFYLFQVLVFVLSTVLKKEPTTRLYHWLMIGLNSLVVLLILPIVFVLAVMSTDSGDDSYVLLYLFVPIGIASIPVILSIIHYVIENKNIKERQKNESDKIV